MEKNEDNISFEKFWSIAASVLTTISGVWVIIISNLGISTDDEILVKLILIIALILIIFLVYNFLITPSKFKTLLSKIVVSVILVFIVLVLCDFIKIPNNHKINNVIWYKKNLTINLDELVVTYKEADSICKSLEGGDKWRLPMTKDAEDLINHFNGEQGFYNLTNGILGIHLPFIIGKVDGRESLPSNISSYWLSDSNPNGNKKVINLDSKHPGSIKIGSYNLNTAEYKYACRCVKDVD
ncbi:hypothetical protein [uncultured Kordia sp.]|uniref:hypothetical protein n=1 Tax=uncultured Kordia sp. TaxID=507699 RepID=UPI002616041D|nr:hypothetical protein [uncultured Kordia sp.]